ncbi:MAG: hypothetical protein QW478_14955 [Candidatus Micrarchaeaceae archaeon]
MEFVKKVDYVIGNLTIFHYEVAKRGKGKRLKEGGDKDERKR